MHNHWPEKKITCFKNFPLLESQVVCFFMTLSIGSDSMFYLQTSLLNWTYTCLFLHNLFDDVILILATANSSRHPTFLTLKQGFFRDTQYC